jgi:prevent-host-death family protein
MRVWQLQEAKAKLTQLVNESMLEPQIISRRGVEETVVISIKKYRQLIGKKEDIVSFFRKSPLNDLDLDLKRDSLPIREVDL